MKFIHDDMELEKKVPSHFSRTNASTGYENNLYHEECELYDDYLTFLQFIRLSQINDLKCYIIPGKYIYL